jgi:hypothetical protein
VWQESPRSASGLSYDVDARLIGDRLTVTVVEPYPGAAALSRRFPAIYVLDPSATLDIVVGAKRLFDIFSGGVLPLTYSSASATPIPTSKRAAFAISRRARRRCRPG